MWHFVRYCVPGLRKSSSQLIECWASRHEEKLHLGSQFSGTSVPNAVKKYYQLIYIVFAIFGYVVRAF